MGWLAVRAKRPPASSHTGPRPGIFATGRCHTRRPRHLPATQRTRLLAASPSIVADQSPLDFAIYAKESEMAQRVTIEMMDDLDGSQADETVRFAVDGNAYEIDLSKKNAAEMRRTFDRYIEHARKAARGTRQARTSRNRRHSSDVRAWRRAGAFRSTNAAGSLHQSLPSTRRRTPRANARPPLPVRIPCRLSARTCLQFGLKPGLYPADPRMGS